MANVVVHRSTGGFWKWRALRIDVDGEQRAVLRRNSAISLALQAGTHTVTASIGRQASNRLQIEARADHPVSLVVRPTSLTIAEAQANLKEGGNQLTVEESDDPTFRGFHLTDVVPASQFLSGLTAAVLFVLGLITWTKVNAAVAIPIVLIALVLSLTNLRRHHRKLRQPPT